MAYCALAERLGNPGVNATDSLTPFFADVCRLFSGNLFDAAAFGSAFEEKFGLKIPRLAALGFTEQLLRAGLLVNVASQNGNPIYRYANQDNVVEVASEIPVTEKEIKAVLSDFLLYCHEDSKLKDLSDNTLQEAFLSRLLNIDSMRILARRENSISTKRSSNTLTLKRSEVRTEDVQELHLDFLVSQFILDLRDKNSARFELVSNIAFANMAAEAVALFNNDPGDSSTLSGLSIYIDTPLILDMLGVNSEYSDYGSELLDVIKASGAQAIVLEHCINEAEKAIQAQLSYLRSGVNKLSHQWGIAAKPDLLSALVGRVAERVHTRLEIAVERDPDLNLHKKHQSLFGDIESSMSSKMAHWKNEEAKGHDKKSVWAILGIRDTSSPCVRICDSRSIFLTRNTALVNIANSAWREWLKGSTKHPSVNIDRWSPIALSDKQFAGYIWARSPGKMNDIPRIRLLAHCSAAVRPRSDIKAKAYNLILDLHGKAEADDIAALLEDREGIQALMRVSKGDPEDVTAERIPYIMEQIKLAAGEFAAAKVRDEAKEALENERNRAAKAEKDWHAQRALDQSKQQTATAKWAARLAAEKKGTERLEALLAEKLLFEKERRNQGLQFAFKEAKLTYERWRFAVASFATIIVCAGTYYSSDIGWVYILIVGFSTFCGFQYIPKIADFLLCWIANKRLIEVLELKEIEDIQLLQMPDYRVNQWCELNQSTDESLAPDSSLDPVKAS